MDDKLPRSIDNEFIRLRNWGGVSALRFIDGGQAVEAIVPIAVNGVRFDPIVDHDDPLLVEKRRLRAEQRRLETELPDEDI